MTTTTSPGWYPDPANPRLVRWYNGTEWTAQTRAIPSASQIASPEAAPSIGGPRRQTMTDAQGRRMRGILWFLGSIAAIILLASGVGVDVSGIQVIFWGFVLGIAALAVLVVRALVRLGDRRPTPVHVVVAPAPGLTAGWYPDQQDASLVRWHDGTQWTLHTQPANS
ncbi:conserved hypothetical protein (plasmid) [Rhodococcus jostii RHA1]|uniref:DUF2510 domain-containing protein n=3 Tax=Nocardiaceae TaxID=85025 RepID=Q0RWX5_RHOJR|nr:conserved hypothetical protein [Rhodococcus jostii RHA1]